MSGLGLLSKKQLKEEILKVWNGITPETIQPFIKSFHKRLLAVFNAKGKHTSY